jgi:hypothetical protein
VVSPVVIFDRKCLYSLGQRHPSSRWFGHALTVCDDVHMLPRVLIWSGGAGSNGIVTSVAKHGNQLFRCPK